MNGTDLIIFCGQSNMEGETEGMPQDLSAVENAYEYKFLTDEIVPLKHPVGENIGHDGRLFDIEKHPDFDYQMAHGALFGPYMGHANMVPSFAKAYTLRSKRQMIAVHTAKGSTCIDYWLKGEKGYAMLVKKTLAAIEKANPEHIYFVWLQGESDAIRGLSKEEYKSKLIQLFSDLKTDAGVEKFGIILVGRFTDDDRDFEIINAQKEVCAETDGFVMLTAITEEIIDNPMFMRADLHGHYNIKGQELIGNLSGNMLGRIVCNQKQQ